MATRKGSDNRFPLVRLVEAAVDSDPTPAGELHLRANNATSLPYVVDDAGNVTHWGVGLHDHTGAADGGDLDAAVIDGYVVFNEESAPGNADSGTVRVYAKSDGKLYAKDDAGTEHDLTAGGSATTVSVHGAKVTRASTEFSVGNNVYTAVEWDAEVFDTDTMHDNSTNPSRVDIPSISGVTTGLWQLRCFGYTDADTGRVDVMYRKNAAGNPASGTLIDAIPGVYMDDATAIVGSFHFACVAVLADTDYVEAFVRTTGVDGDVEFDAAAPPRFEVIFLGKVT